MGKHMNIDNNNQLLKKITCINHNKKDILSILQKYGMCILPNYVTDKICDTTKEKCIERVEVKEDVDFEDGSYRRFDGKNIHPKGRGQDKRVYHVDCFSNEMADFKNDKFIQSICESYMSKEESPHSVHVQIYDRNNIPNDLTRGPHLDSFETNTFKAFLYLDTVTLDDGPTSYILKTHKDKILRELKQKGNPGPKYLNKPKNKSTHPTNFSLEELGQERINNWVKVTGNKGDVILFDTWGVHCGTNISSNGDRHVIVNYYKQGKDLPRSNFGYDYKIDEKNSGNFK
tara:strand:+ start:28 stop:888 length:861 start_codon:yes stop_codon:yes gene_type:complete